MITDLLPIVALRRDLALAIARSVGLSVTLTSGFRSSEKQAQLRQQYEQCLAQGQTISPGNPNAACRYPANRPGDSSHEYGLSWDSSVVGGDREWEAWTIIRTALGFTVPSNDRVHAEVPGWRSIATLLYQAGLVPTAPLGAAPVAQVAYNQAPTATSSAAQVQYPYEFNGVRYRCSAGVPVWAQMPPWDSNQARCP